MMHLLLSDIAALTKGRLFGDDGQIGALRRLGDAREGHLGVVLRPQALRFLPACKATGVLLGVSDAADYLDRMHCSVVVVEDPFEAMSTILHALHDENVGPAVYIGERVKFGAHCVIGGEGFVFRDTDHGQVRLPHFYGVIIGDDVELGSHVCVDRGMLGPTVIGARTKIDNLVQIGHDVVIGSDCAIVAQTGIAGHARIGDHVSIGGQAGVGPFVSVGNRVQISAKSAVFSDIGDGEIWSGSPAMPHMQYLRASAAFKKLARNS